MMIWDFLHKHRFSFIIILSVAFVFVVTSLIILNDYKSNVADIEMTKRILFCQDKLGKQEYSFVCHKSGECEKQYLNCDYINYLVENDVVQTGNINYQKINEEYNKGNFSK